MITYAQALEIVNRELAQQGQQSSIDVVVVTSRTIEQDFGWVFRYESKKALETQDIRYALSGNGPIIVDRYTGVLHRFSSALSSRDAIHEYEAELAKGMDRDSLVSLLKEIAQLLDANAHSEQAEYVAALATVAKWGSLAVIPGLKSGAMWGGAGSVLDVTEFNSRDNRRRFVSLLVRLAQDMRRYGITTPGVESAAREMSSWLVNGII